VATYTWVFDVERSDQVGRPVHYNVAVVALDGTTGDPVRMVSNVVDAWTEDDLSVGMRVELVTLRLSDEVGLPLFRTATGNPQ
jgi:hypothetical protein